jgi:hypothetical protein
LTQNCPVSLFSGINRQGSPVLRKMMAIKLSQQKMATWQMRATYRYATV